MSVRIRRNTKADHLSPSFHLHIYVNLMTERWAQGLWLFEKNLEIPHKSSAKIYSGTHRGFTKTKHRVSNPYNHWENVKKISCATNVGYKRRWYGILPMCPKYFGNETIMALIVTWTCFTHCWMSNRPRTLTLAGNAQFVGYIPGGWDRAWNSRFWLPPPNHDETQPISPTKTNFVSVC